MLLYRHSLTSCTGLGLRRLVPVTPQASPLKHLHELSEAVHSGVSSHIDRVPQECHERCTISLASRRSYLEPYDAVVHRRLQELGDLINQVPVLRLIKPAQFRDAADLMKETTKQRKVLDIPHGRNAAAM